MIISACADRTTGVLRLVTSGQPCRAHETALSWGSGLLGYEIVSSDETFDPNASLIFAGHGADCPAGKRVLGGGATALIVFQGQISPAHSSTLTVNQSYPSDQDTWIASYTFSGPSSVVGIRVFAICAY